MSGRAFDTLYGIVRQIPAGKAATHGPAALWTWSGVNGTLENYHGK